MENDLSFSTSEIEGREEDEELLSKDQEERNYRLFPSSRSLRKTY